MTTMTLQEKILYHQIHPWKLAADIGGWGVSMYFFWQHDLLLGLAVQFVPAILASLLVIRYAGLEPIKNSKAGAYLKRHMTRTIEAVRLAGNFVTVFGAWLRRPLLIALGLAIVILAWSAGAMRTPSSN